MLYQISIFMRPGGGIHAKAHQSDDGTHHWVSIRSDSGNAVMHSPTPTLPTSLPT